MIKSFIRPMKNISDNTLISVIMGVRYQRESTALLKRALDSILDQTHVNLEIIICERDSTPLAKSCLTEYAVRDNRIMLIDGSNTSSFSEQLNLCLNASSGEWIARMDDDDYSFPERLECQLDFLKGNLQYAFVGCESLLIQDGKEIGRTGFPNEPGVKDFLFTQPFIHPSLVFRREALEKVGGYSEAARCDRCEDYDLLLRLYENGLYGYNIAQPLFAYSTPPNGVTNRNFRDRLNELKTRFVRFKALKLFPMALPYVIKPILVWIVPKRLVAYLKSKAIKKQ